MTQPKQAVEQQIEDLLITTVNMGSINQNARRHYVRKAKAALLTLLQEARTDELNSLLEEQEDSQHWEWAHPGYSTSMVTVSVIADRLAELAQQRKPS